MSNSTPIINDEKTKAAMKVGKKKKKKIIKTIIILAIIATIIVYTLFRFGILGNKNVSEQAKLTTYTVSTRSITEVLTSSGTIEPNDQYTINALVNGEIIADYFEEGDTVIEDQLLFRFDSDSLNSGVTRAENTLKNANKSLNDALENLEKLNVETEVSGKIKKIHVEIGDEITQGTLIADIVDNETMCADIPFMEIDASEISVGDIATVTFDTYEEATGTVTEISPVTYINNLGVSVRDITVSVKNTGSITTSTRAFAKIGDAYCTADGIFYYNDEGQVFSKIGGEVSRIYFKEGQKIFDGQTIVRLESDDLEDNIEKLRDNVNEAEDSLEDANDAFDNYNIEAPITGKVISKSYKTGDTISGGMNGSSTLAVIYDMSALKFSMSIDELDIDKLEEGQDVIVTCDSREGVEYHGVISNISIQGSTTSGTTVYPVEVTIENIEDIDKRTVSEDGTVNKVYKTGMTSTETTYSLLSSENINGDRVYRYSEGIIITVKHDGSIYDGEKLLKSYLDGTYTQGSNFYSFANDYSSLTLEIQNDKKMLRPGMNIDAEIIVENRENVIAVPLAAVGRGNIVKVIKTTEVKESNAPDNANKIPQRPDASKDKTSMNFDRRDGYGISETDAQYEEVRVTLGISDDDYVEITSGLVIGDVVIVDTANLAANTQNLQFGGMMGGMQGGAMIGGGMPGGVNRGPMGR